MAFLSSTQSQVAAAAEEEEPVDSEASSTPQVEHQRSLATTDTLSAMAAKCSGSVKTRT